jgi:membrane protease YdiL (CAAX protease family)
VNPIAHSERGPSRREMIITLLGFVVLWALLDRAAALLGSLRGEAGLAVCAIVLGAAVVIERVVAKRRPKQALEVLGLGAPDARAWWASLALVAALLCFYPLFAFAAHASLTLRPGAPALMLGMFAQGGIAEEVVFRGFLFRRLRERRGFWRAAVLASIPFAAVHAVLFFTLDFPVALASVLLALSLSFPLAWLFERSGGSIWPPAIVHAVVQGSIKVVDAGTAFTSMAIAWMVIGALAPWLLFLLKEEHPQRAREAAAPQQ